MSRIFGRSLTLLAFGLTFAGMSDAAQTPVNISASSGGFTLQVVTAEPSGRGETTGAGNWAMAHL